MSLEKNKSSVYVFPVLYYKMQEEGLDGDIINFIDNTFLYDKNKLFTIKLTKENIYTKETISQDLVDNVKENSYVDSVTETEDNYIIRLKINNEFDDLINKFKEGLYSNISEQDKVEILDFNWHFCGLDKYIEIGYILFKNKEYRKLILAKYNIDDSKVDDIELDSVINLKDETYDEGSAEEANKGENTEIQ